MDATTRPSTFIEVNDAFIKKLGYTREEIIGKPSTLVLSDRSYNPPLDTIYEVLNSGKPITFEAQDRTKNGIIIPSEVITHKVQLEGKDVYLSVSRDITIQKQIEQELRDAEAQRMKFEAMVSHELRTPLQAILGFTELLGTRDGQLDEEVTKFVVSMIKKNVSRLENIANTIIDVSDMEYNIHKLKLKTLDFREFINEIQETYKHLGIKFFPCGSINPIFLEGDIEKLYMVFDHLIDNAMRNTNEKNRLITITPVLLETSIQITVIDNGAGIAKENLEKIFEKFVSIPTEYSVDGMGVGLYFVQQIILAHGGTITASSKGIGQGATFTICLPLKDLL
ncbi:MAG: PAS domain-containing sensor histidine kinase [Candidatus Hodarchaeales archaeon]|jgi:PAS domain S-box-containing protein